MTKQHGVKRIDIDIWLKEFMFRRKNIDINPPKGVKEVFYKLLVYILDV